MKNKLERFVQQNRDDFDSDLPERNIWKEIEQLPATPVKKIFGYFTRMQVAATVLVIVNVAVLAFLFERKIPLADTVTVKAPAEQVMENKEPVYQAELDQISKVIEAKLVGLKEIKRSNPVLYKKFTSALEQLNDSYRELEKDLNNNPNREQLLEAMIQNLSLQQELLNQQLSIYQKIKQNKHEKFTKNI